MLTKKQQQVYDEIVQGINRGIVPSINDLARKYGVSPNAIRDRLILIEKKGYLEREGYKKYKILK